jgi:hypothetical protein
VTPVVAIILHVAPEASAGSLETAFGAMRAANATRLGRGFERAGVSVTIEAVRRGGPPFGARVRTAARNNAGAGLVILGSGSIPLASLADLRAFTEAAAAPGPILANNRYSSDVIAIPATTSVAELPDVASDNALPRWFAARGAAVRDLARRWRLQVDLDSPIDGYLVGLAGDDGTFDRVTAVASRLRSVAGDPGAELLVVGRTSSGTLRWLERSTASRTRAVVEERGMRTARDGQRPARSILGLLLDEAGPAALGTILAGLGDGAVVDSRVLLAHRLGADETGWPPAEDRFASDLLLHERVADPWLRDLTRAAAEATIPVLLGGHTLVGPGLRLLLRDAPR